VISTDYRDGDKVGVWNPLTPENQGHGRIFPLSTWQRGQASSALGQRRFSKDTSTVSVVR